MCTTSGGAASNGGATVPEVAPGPPGDPLLGHLRAFRRDVLTLLLDGAREHGDVVRFRVGPLVAHLVNHPDLIAEVLQAGHRRFDKQTRPDVQRHLDLPHALVGFRFEVPVPELKRLSAIAGDFEVYDPTGASFRLSAPAAKAFSAAG